MEVKVTAKEIEIMKITIGLRADLVSNTRKFKAERNYYYCVNASWSGKDITSGSETLKCIKGLMEKGLMEEKTLRSKGRDILCYQLSESGREFLEKIFDCAVILDE